MQWDCWHLQEGHMEKGGSAEGGYKEHRTHHGSFFSNPSQCRVPSIARPPSNARYSRTHLST